MTKKEEVKKITEDELKLVQEKVGTINQLQMQVGGLEVQKQMAVAQVQVVQGELSEVQKGLEEAYGQVSVNLQDGTITEIPKEDEQADQKN